MPWSALPEHLNTPEAWNGYDDDDHWYTSWRKYVKGWFAFGPRATERWARFRNIPIILFAVQGEGRFRLESDQYPSVSTPEKIFTWRSLSEPLYYYLSRVQYWTNWHIGLQWPLFLHGHRGGWQFYIGFKRDADRVYWLALYFGRIWK